MFETLAESAPAEHRIDAVDSWELSRQNVIRQELGDLQQRVGSPFNQASVLSGMFELVDQLDDQPQHGLADYDLIVGDDTGGRLPALLNWRIVNARRAEYGREPAAIRFMNGRYDLSRDDYEQLEPGLFPKESTDDARTLIATEYVESGNSVGRILEVVRTQRRASQIDVATIIGKPSSLDHLELPESVQYFRAAIGSHAPNIPTKMIGVTKQGPTLHARGLPKDYRDGRHIANAREDIMEIAETFYPLLRGSK